MTNRIITITLLALLPLCSMAQSRRDMERIEQHRKKPSDAPLLQSWTDTTGIKSTWEEQDIIGTWLFLEEEQPTTADAETVTLSASETKDNIHKEIPVLLDIDPSMYADLDFITRLSVLNPELILPYNADLKQMILNYVERHKRSLEFILGKYIRLEPVFRSIFRKHGIPEDLTVLAIVESAMNPTAVSPADARGMWQFMSYTAKTFGLRCDGIVDERYDQLRSADAAARLLKSAYAYYGDWALAISSYNCGKGNVDKAIARAGGKRDFWSIYPYLPRETKGYMPAFVASLYSLYFYQYHDMNIRQSYDTPSVYYNVNRRMTFNEISQATGMDMTQIAKLNPQYIMGIIPGNERTFSVRIPTKYSKLYKDNIDTLTYD